MLGFLEALRPALVPIPPCLDPWEQAFAGVAAAAVPCPVQQPPLPCRGMLARGCCFRSG